MTTSDSNGARPLAAGTSTAGFDYQAQLANAIALSSTTNQVVWTVFGIFWAANAVLLVALFTTGDLPRRAPGMIISAVGLGLCASWLLIQLRAIRYLGFYEAVVHEIEETHLEAQRDVALSRRLNEKYEASVGARWWSMRTVMLFCAVVSLLSWAWAFAWFYARPSA